MLNVSIDKEKTRMRVIPRYSTPQYATCRTPWINQLIVLE
jgi:hypothetical protein